ncbi:MAG: DUF4065 domain-containing protein [Thiomargarita sp.]|nr:DUF4065 domain-containing protein [Thiomargarita sp.]
MTNVFDVAVYILKKRGTLSTMKLQKLVYYSQAWALVWDDTPLFSDQIEAWANGPVVTTLYNVHKGEFSITDADLQSYVQNELTENQKDTIDTVLKVYGDKSAQWLSDQTHIDAPWQEARIGLCDSERGHQEITLASLSEYYGSLQ